jgi:mannose-1-phosphate guanylyltransferase / mannose-6-phosphate isomerase
MLVPVILSGGTGTRLWPVSREASPKPFMCIGEGPSLLRRTLDRALVAGSGAEVITVTNGEYLFRTRDEYAGAQGARHTFILEPFGRNTAPAVAAAALHLRDSGRGEAVMLVLAADHVINDAAAFAADCRVAETLAQEGRFVTFGIPPTAPETGFGYIELGEALAMPRVFDARRFVEKPYFEFAQRYVESGNYLWNSGMFAFRADRYLEALARHAAAVDTSLARCWSASARRTQAEDNVIELDAPTFRDVPDISVDYAVMEYVERVVVIRASFDWSDVGSWGAVGEMARPDALGNSVVGEAVLVDARNTFVQSEGRVIAVVGVDNLIIVDTPDALLVADRDRTQDVRKVVEQLKGRAHESVRVHRTVTRPWGTYTVLEEGEGFKIKRIVVKPGQSLSLQMHHHRSEHWVVVAGAASVVNGEEEHTLKSNESTYIPAGRKHRLANPGTTDLVIIEVQSGDYVGEDDIVRFSDHYGRV